MSKKVTVLSLFDGMSCGQLAFKEAGIKIDKYYSSEVDKYAMQVTQHNFPNTIQLGDVTKLKVKVKKKHVILITSDGKKYKIKGKIYLIGGSPCQGFSFAGKMKGAATKCNIEITTLEQYLKLKKEDFAFDGQSYLFWEYIRILRTINPEYFFLENVMMVQKWKTMFNEAVGIEPIMINSALVSAQTRKRLYWTNIPNVEQPEDKGILLKDVLEDDYFSYKDKSYALTCHDGTLRDFFVKSQSNIVFLKDEKGKLKVKQGYIYFSLPNSKEPNKIHKYPFGKGIVIPEATKKGYTEIEDGDCFDYAVPNYKTRRGRNMKNKSNALLTSNQFMKYEGNYKYRKLTPKECERLQTVPDDYTSIVSNSQRYKMLGNGWTVAVPAHVFKNIN